MNQSTLNSIPTLDQLRTIDDSVRAAAIFQKNIRMVEIEVFSYCNRRCWYCPNSEYDRISTNNYMPPEMYSSLIGQLASINYKGMITYSRYNEPFADRIILDRICEARASLPEALIHTNTNGDYLSYDYIEEIYEAGMRSISIQFYLKNEERYNHAAIIDRANQTADRIKLPCKLVRDEPGVWFEYEFEFRDMRIRGYGRNFELNGTSRGGEVDIHRDYQRTSPCVMPFWSVYIDYNGMVMPCCNLRSDIPKHKEYVVGDLVSQNNLFLNYVNKNASQFRLSLLNMNVKGGLCRDCHFALETPSQSDVKLMAELVRQAG